MHTIQKYIGLCCICLSTVSWASPSHWVISTVAGTPENTTATYGGSGAFSGDGRPARFAQLNRPEDVAFDGLGNLYIADTWNQRIRKIDRAGIISTVAGNGKAGFSGDGDLATQAQLSYPSGIAVSDDGVLYIADTRNRRIRRVDINGIISTVAGTGEYGETGDGFAATNATFQAPYDVAINAQQVLYIVDKLASSIRVILADGTIQTLLKSPLFEPQKCHLDDNGDLYIADTLNNRIHRINTQGQFVTVAGAGKIGLFASKYERDGNLAIEAELSLPRGIAVDRRGQLFISDLAWDIVRYVDTDGYIHRLAGDFNRPGYRASEGEHALGTPVNFPEGIALDEYGAVYFADAYNHRIRKVAPNQAPQARFKTSTQTDRLVFDAQASSDPENGDLRYLWHNSNSDALGNLGTQAQLSLPLDNLNDTIELVVIDAVGSRDTLQGEIANNVETACFGEAEFISRLTDFGTWQLYLPLIHASLNTGKTLTVNARLDFDSEGRWSVNRLHHLPSNQQAPCAAHYKNGTLSIPQARFMRDGTREVYAVKMTFHDGFFELLELVKD